MHFKPFRSILARFSFKPVYKTWFLFNNGRVVVDFYSSITIKYDANKFVESATMKKCFLTKYSWLHFDVGELDAVFIKKVSLFSKIGDWIHSIEILSR